MHRRLIELLGQIYNMDSLKRTPLWADATACAEFFIYPGLVVFIQPNAILASLIDRAQLHAQIAACNMIALVLFYDSYPDHSIL